jgi:NADPH-dependent 2,4-dienoyl-CoA reductase/sulfur reductase-like enzyme
MVEPTSPFKLRTGPLPATADVVIIGAGVIGCATAFYATAAGLRTAVVDARPQPAIGSSSNANGTCLGGPRTGPHRRGARTGTCVHGVVRPCARPRALAGLDG